MAYHDRLAVSGVLWLVRIDFSPRQPKGGFLWGPWRDEPSTLVINCSVYAVQNETAVKTGLTRRILSRLLAREFAEITRYGLFTSYWHFQACLHTKSPAVECVWQVRKGVKIVRFKKLLTDLKPAELTVDHR
jgi:hypothetical protein